MSGPAPGTAEWARVVTASKVAAILGVSPWDSPRSMWHVMRGDIPADDGTNAGAKSRGHYLEAGVLAWWADRHPVLHLDTQVHTALPGVPWAAATPDALAILDGGEQVIVEVKTAARMDEWGEPGTDQIPVHYLAQVHWQLAMCPAAARAFVPVLGPFLDFAEYVVERDDEVCADLIARCARFVESLAGDEPPVVDGHPATLAAVRRTHPDIDRDADADLPHDVALEYLTAAAALADAETRDRAARAAVLDLMGDARIAYTAGVKVARRQPNRTGVSLVKTATINDLTGDAA